MTRCLEQIGATPPDIDEVAVCGNTTMQQVFAGFHPYGLGVFPYFPLTLTPPVLSAGDLGLATDPAGPSTGNGKVIKGGSFLCADNYCQRYRPAARRPQMIDTGMSHIGFRTIRTRSSS